MSNCDGVLQAIGAKRFHSSWVCVDHVSFSLDGAWFISFSDGTVQISAHERFPDAFYALAAPYPQIPGPVAISAMHSPIKYVFFGAGSSVIIKLANNGVIWDDIQEDMAAELRLFGSKLYSLGKNIVLCP